MYKMRNKPRFTFIDLFAGIGGFRLALESNGGICLGYSEIDKEAVKVYRDNYVRDESRELELGDITKLSNLPPADCIVGGVPCQSWSVAGKMRGFGDPRGRLWMDSIRLVDINRPKVFVFENVKGLFDPRNRDNLELIISKLKPLGYKIYCKLLNSFDFGLPQNRERIFIVGIRSDLNSCEEFEFPSPLKTSIKLFKFIDNVRPSGDKKEKFNPKRLFGDKIPMGRNRFQKIDTLNDFFVFCDTRNGHSTIHSWDIISTSRIEKKICETIMKNRRKSIYGDLDGNPIPIESLRKLIDGLRLSDLKSLVSKKILREVVNKGYEFVNSKNSSGINGIYRIYLPESCVFSTLTATGTRDMVALESVTGRSPEEFKKNFIEKIYLKNKFRKISPKEAASLQGFPYNFKIHKKEQIAHRQFGNAVSVPVVYNVFKSILKTGVLD